MFEVFVIETEYIIDDPIEEEPRWAVFFVAARNKDEAVRLVRDDLEKTDFFVGWDMDNNPIYAKVKKIKIKRIKTIDKPQILYVM